LKIDEHRIRGGKTMADTKPLIVLAAAGMAALSILSADMERAFAHKEPHTRDQLEAFHEVFMDQVTVGDLLFHGDPATEERLGVNLSNTGMACAMCHPYTSDTHPHEFPKYQEQMAEFATLRDMINWCIEKPNEGEKIDPDGEAMKALESYIYWSNRNSKLDPGRH
jgi:thiosulfate dehydrogenase